jgi:hypothetical protein
MFYYFWTHSLIFTELIFVFKLYLNLSNHYNINWFVMLFMFVLTDVHIVSFYYFIVDCQC